MEATRIKCNGPKQQKIWVQREIFCKKVFGKKYRAMKENSVECQGQRTTNKCMNSEKKKTSL